MSTTVPTSSDVADEAEFYRILTEIDHLRAQMQQDDVVIAILNADIAALKAESRVLQNNAQTHLDRALSVLDSLHDKSKA